MSLYRAIAPKAATYQNAYRPVCRQAAPKVALVIDWLTNLGGAERVLLSWHHLFPDAPIFTTIYNSAAIPEFSNTDIRTSFLQKFPGAKTKWQRLLPLMPMAIESFDFSGFDIVISNSTCIAKGVITKPNTLHICYCNSPMRYAWDNYHAYTSSSKKFGKLSKLIIPFLMSDIRQWDFVSAKRVDKFIGNSGFIVERIKKYYRRPADVLYPPIHCDQFHTSDNPKDYFLIVSRLVPNKHVDLAIKTFNKLGLPLKIAGGGPQEHELRKLARKNIEFLGHISEEEKTDLLANCKAFLYPQEEDFGISAVEAMASGRPVIAFRSGGACETVIDGQTGIFFDKQEPDCLAGAVRSFRAEKFNPGAIAHYARGFDIEQFNRLAKEIVNKYWLDWQRSCCHTTKCMSK